MALILDALIILIVCLTFYFVIKKGFIKSLLDLLSVVFAVILAKIFASKLAVYMFNLLKDLFGEKIDLFLKDIISNDSNLGSSKLNELSTIFEKYDLDSTLKLDGLFLEEPVAAISGSIIGILSYFLAYILIFVAVLIAFKIITPLICLIFKLPLLKTINKTLSVLLAVVLAVIYLLVFIAIMQLLIPFLSSVYPEHINETVVERSYIFDYLYSLEWLKIFVS